jgi:sarcosine oxidase subunit gamma
MSEAISALSGATFDGFANIREVGPLGMISLRATPDIKGLGPAIKAAVGSGVPKMRQILTVEGRSAAWMAPDEYLLILPYADVGKTLEMLGKKLAGSHHLVIDVSDARAVFRIEGGKAEQVLAKLCPVDLANVKAAEVRRTRAAQVACAIWRNEAGFTLVCFRSVSAYVMGLLTHSAQPGSELS